MSSARKLVCQDSCLKYASVEGNLAEVESYLLMGAIDKKRAALAAARVGKTQSVMKLLDNGVEVDEELVVASSFSGDSSLVDKLEGMLSEEMGEEGYTGVLVGAVHSGSLALVKKALRETTPLPDISWFISPKKGFKKIVKELIDASPPGTINLNMSLIACARTSPPDEYFALHKKLVKSGCLDEDTVQESFVQSVYGNNTKLRMKLEVMVTMDEELKQRSVRAAAHAPCMSVLKSYPEYVDEDVVNIAAMRGNAEVVKAHMNLVTSLTLGYAAYSGDPLLLSTLSVETEFDCILVSLGAVRSGNMLTVVEYIARVTPTESFIALLIAHGSVSKSQQARKFCTQFAMDYATDYHACVQKAAAINVDIFPLMKHL